MTPFEVYKTYLAIKKHFCDVKYDYHKYNGKTRTSEKAFTARKDRYFFERMSRKMSDDEVKLYFISNFVSTDNPSSVWIGQIIQSGERNYQEMQKRHQSLTYMFQQECASLFDAYKLDQVFDCKKGHPPALKSYLAGDISIETLVMLNVVFQYVQRMDKKLSDPVWEEVSNKIKKYTPFLNINMSKCKTILRDMIL